MRYFLTWLISVAWMCGFLAACPAFMTICGYITDTEELMGWSGVGKPVMALNTAICLLLLSFATMFISFTMSKMRTQ